MMNTELPFVLLRALEPEDLDLLYTIENDPKMWEVSSGNAPISKYVLRQYIASQPNEVFAASELRLVIEDADRGLAVGLADLTSISLIDGRAEVGIAVLKEEQGKHYGKVALERLGQYAKQFLNLRFLYAYVSAEENERSVNLFESEGYERLALLPEWHYRCGKYEDVLLFRKKL